MTDKSDGDTANNQHHQGTDWIYGGWDRDVLQADVASNGPNPGDRLIDWNGAYNLFTQRPKQELADFSRWTGLTKPGDGDDFYRVNGAGEMLVFSAADFEDFTVR